MDIEDKVALVTGGAAGIGLECVKELLNNGARGVTMVDIDERGSEVCEELNKTFSLGAKTPKVIFAKANVVDKASLEAAFKATIDTFKNLDIVINNAGIMNEIQWEQACDVNIKGVINGILLATDEYLPKYKSTADAVVINTSSLGGLLQPLDVVPIYGATKSAVIALSLSFGSEYHFKRTGVRVLTVCPAATDTHLMHRAGDGVVHADLLEDSLKFHKCQEVSCVAKAFIYAIKEGKSGTIHLVMDGVRKEIFYPNFLEQLMSINTE